MNKWKDRFVRKFGNKEIINELLDNTDKYMAKEYNQIALEIGGFGYDPEIIKRADKTISIMFWIKKELKRAKTEERKKIASMKPAIRDSYLFPENAVD